MLVIPITAVPSQTITVQLAGQPCRIAIYQKTTGLYLDLFLNDVVVVTGVLCLDAVFLVRDPYFNFIGDLSFFDMQGGEDPLYTGLGSRWFLAYLAPGELVFDVIATIPPFLATDIIIDAGDGYFLSYDGVNPIAAFTG
jgi:hypothetical protein